MLEKLADHRWDHSTAAHLLNRAGFGGTPWEVEELVRLGPAKAVARLLEFDRVPDPLPAPEWARPDPTRAERMQALRNAAPLARGELLREAQRAQQARLLELRAWWLRRMASGIRPLQEKLTLFWHGHFATGFSKVRSAYLMWRQNDLFRRHATGNWRTLLQEVTKDPAMLIWLDQARSNRRHPNENYARELMELFTLGEGYYTEKDVTEAARALTGIGYDNQRQEFVYRPGQHDDGEKTFLGKTGPLIAKDVIDQILAQPQAARFLVTNLWTFFANEDPGEEVINDLARQLRESNYELKPVLSTLLQSEAFYTDAVMRQKVKSPVEFLVMAVRQLERELPPPFVTTTVLRLLGQDLFAPPNVKGWDGGIAWITTNTLVQRHNLAALFVFGQPVARPQLQTRRPGRPATESRFAGRMPPVELEPLFLPAKRGDRDQLFAALEQRFLAAPLSPHAAATLRALLAAAQTLDDHAVRQAIRLTLCTPDYQLT
jgi:uncharacterized protein (DUF1800 family)